jgi:vancomycin resistance protein YoaR
VCSSDLIQVRCAVDPERVQRTLIELAPQVNREPKNAEVHVEGDQVEVAPGAVGRALDIAASRAALVKALSDPDTQQIKLVVKTQYPAVSEADLAHMEIVLSRYTTEFNPGKEDRTHNLKVAIGILNRSIVKAGGDFSLNDVLGPRVTEKGYRDAPIFVNGEIEPSTGGGVCQVASTVYNAALLANLEVKERHHHSRPVDYTPAGRDATVYYGQLDLKFTNTLKNPLMVLGDVSGDKLTITLIGARDDKTKVQIVRTAYASLGHGKKEFLDPTLPPGTRQVETKGYNGAKATIVRRVMNGDEVAKEEVLHADTYTPMTTVVRVGPPKKPVPPPASPSVPRPAAGPPPPMPGVLRTAPGTARPAAPRTHPEAGNP